LREGVAIVGISKFRYTVLATVSAAALIVSVERGIAADVPTCQNDRWWGSIEGQYLLYDGDSAKYGFEGDDPEDQFSLKPKDGWGVGGEIGFQPACSPWSFLGRVRYGQSNKDKDSFSSTFDGSAYSAEADHREEHIVADLEIGRDVGLGALGDGSNVRVFAGLRFAHFKGKGSFSTYSEFDGVSSDVDVKRKFTGIGPRIGFDAMVPLSEQFSLDLGAAGALLFGKQKFEAEGTYSSFAGPSDIDDKRSKSVVVPNLEASAAFSWLVTDNAKFSLGYRVDSYFDIYDNGLIFGGRDEGDRIIHGPFIKLTIGSGGDGG
jgi:Legionella pneumophila major outer membrane protein precursor